MKTVPRAPSTRRWIGPKSVQQLINGVSMDLDALPPHPTAEQVQASIDRLTAIRDRIVREDRP
ncbi:hypothetical protein FZ983_32195 [Azospirillum sp. B21]|uniref:hypothetical protein n=1 Tax=Azospirillum sp. B21 TaxID=2607496 RepID=UPI0011EFFA5B|nr:hypothetical protein [Azospirillum sp. B21]KAA0572233.1 hypothetical protein FZ983_32195 [Azospirillum sp. B21]